jgi:hypothetical protein
MEWTKLGRVFNISKGGGEISSHASNPLAIHLKGDIFRIFYSSRNHENKSSVSFVDVDILGQEVINDHCKVVFKYGGKSSFYSHGVSIGNMYEQGEDKYILFMGWQIPVGQHWRGDIGQLLLLNNKDLYLKSSIPFLTIDEEDKISLSYPWVVYHNGVYKMWYGSTISWESVNGEMIHVIKYATSRDGMNWEKHGVAIPYKIGVAQAFSRPSVIIDDIGFHMWYSYRSGKGTTYRIGYAFSSDGIKWVNKPEESGIDVSEEGWDSEMICYPFVFDHNNERYMLYNGNGFGKTGFGLAKLNR